MKITDDFRKGNIYGFGEPPGKIDAAAAIGTLKFIRNTFRKIITSIFYSEEERKLRSGDIIGVCRGVYDHYGVFIDANCVIHYSSKGSDTSSDNSIIETNLETFMRGDGTVFKLWFPKEHREPSKIVARHFYATGLDLRNLIYDEKYHLFTPEETIARAKSRLGENRYSLLFNNCEHFAIWCKTGISESHQLNQFLRCQKEICGL